MSIRIPPNEANGNLYRLCGLAELTGIPPSEANFKLYGLCGLVTSE